MSTLTPANASALLRAAPAPTARASVAAPVAAVPAEVRCARAWLSLAVASLILAGGLALLLVVARTPPLDRLVPDPLFFKRCLVVHVDLSLVVWLYAAASALLFLLPARGASAPRTRLGHRLAAAGVGAMLAAPLLSSARPVLSNYIPVVDHPLFIGGLVAFGAGVLLSLLDGRLAPGAVDAGGAESPVALPPSARAALRACGLALVLAAITLLGSLLSRPAGVEAAVFYELVLWGGGHVLQLASVAAMLACWMLLLGSYLGRDPVGAGAARVLSGALVLPWLAAPLIASAGPQSAAAHGAFTTLMRWALFPAVLLWLALAAKALLDARRDGRLAALPRRDPRLLGFLASAGLTVLGFVIGACIRGSNTMVPGHYHASVGGVTASFMAATIVLLGPLGWPIPTPRLARWASVQPLVFGLGQAVFATGFAVAGAHGAARKVYGAEQAGRTLGETVGLAVMGAGGLVAVAGGLIFLWVVVAARRRSGAAAR
jgi:hypothetical protein